MVVRDEVIPEDSDELRMIGNRLDELGAFFQGPTLPAYLPALRQRPPRDDGKLPSPE